jgi:CheY-like chemotaxis protein
VLIHSNPSGHTGAAPTGVTVLVVEDEVLVRLCTADTLRSAGYTVLEAAGADEAMAHLAGVAGIAVMFSDIQMPGTMDGVELAHFVRATYPALEIILTSGAVARPVGTEDAIAFVAKPYAPEDVAKRIGDLLK